MESNILQMEWNKNNEFILYKLQCSKTYSWYVCMYIYIYIYRPPLWSSGQSFGYRSGGPGSIPGTTKKKKK
jgi:hypothetical protein